MNRILFSFIVAFVTMFGGLGNVQAQEYTVTLNQSSNKAFTGENGGVSFSISNLNSWEEATDASRNTNKHCAGYRVNANTNSVITWSGIPDGYVIAFSKIEVKGTSTSDKNNDKGMDLLTSKSTLKAATVSCNTNQPQTIFINNSIYCRFDNTGSLTIQHGATNMYVNEVSLTYKIIENKYVWKWLGEDLSNNNEYYLRNTLSGKFAKKASTDMGADVTSDDLFKISFRKDNEYYIINKNNKYVAWGNNGFDLNVNSDKNSVWVVVTKYYSYSFNKYGDSYQIAYDNKSYLYSDGTTLAKDDEMSDNLQTYWQLISNDQMDKYNRYMQAHAAAEALGDGEDDATKEQLNQIIAQYENANKDNAEEKIAGLNNLTKVILNIKNKCYGTFVSQFDVTLPDGVVAFGVSAVSDKEVTLSEITLSEQALVSGNAVIVRMDDFSAMRKVYFGPKPETDKVVSNGLLGFYKDDVDITKGNYILQNQGDGQKFYVVGDTPFKSAKNRCCLPAASSEPAKVLNIKFVESEETAVENVTIGASVVGYYSANGAKLSAPKAGVNIVKMSDGTVKKVLVK